MPGKPIPPHGTRQRYNHRTARCRCEACTAANTLWVADYRKRVRTNGTASYTDADGKRRTKRLPR